MEVETMVAPIVEALESGIPVYLYSGYGSSAGRHAVDLLGVLDNGKILMYNPAGTAASAYNIQNGVGNVYEYGDSDNLEENVRTIVSGTSPSLYGAGTNWVIGFFIPDEAPNGKKKKKGPKPYVGYEGNEAVVSPVTGILLDYGTYTDEDTSVVTSGNSVSPEGTGTKTMEEGERTNVDIKNGVHLIGSDENIALESEEPVVDKVGYAKIMVLDAENYRKLEQYSGSNWANNSLVNPNNGNGTARRLLDDPGLTSEDDLDDWDALNKMVYGYKEFAEKYEIGGIAGNIIYIDGFICQDVDTEIEDLEEEIPAGEDVTRDSFNNTELEDKTAWRPSLYKKDAEYKAVRKSITEKIMAEEKLKEDAPSSYTLNAGGETLTFIKEGTVLGRTMSDKELLEAPYLRNGQLGTYDEIRKAAEEETGGEDEDEIKGKIIGNYLRIIFRDKDDTVIENVEDYMKLDEYTGDDDDFERIGNIEEFMYWQAKEPEGFEYILDGQKSYALNYSGGRSRRDNPNDKYGHDYGIDDGGANDDNLCPGMWMDAGSSGREIFKKVTGQDPVRYVTYATGEQLLDIYTQELEVNMEELRNSYPITETLDDEDTRLFALIDVMYAGGGNFKIGTIDDKLLAGDLDLTREDFLSNCTNENAFYRQNENAFTRRRLHDFYMYTEGYYCHDIYDTQGTEITQRWEFKSDTPFQDLMVDEEGAELVDL